MVPLHHKHHDQNKIILLINHDVYDEGVPYFTSCQSQSSFYSNC